MKIFKHAALLVLAGLGLVTHSAQAQLSYNGGDLFIGFRDSVNTTNDYLVDVGQASLYTLNNGSTFTLNIGNTASDLNSILNETNFFTSGNVFWGVIGGPTTNDVANTIYAGKPESTLGTFPVSPGSTYNPTSSNNQGVFLGHISTMEIGYGEGSATSNSTVGTSETASNSNSWYTTDGHGGTAFGKYTGFEGNIDTGNGGDALDLFQIVPGGSSPTYEGRFVIASTGGITYQTAGTVPEPSTLTALAGGAGLLGLVRRRRAVAA